MPWTETAFSEAVGIAVTVSAGVGTGPDPSQYDSSHLGEIAGRSRCGDYVNFRPALWSSWPQYYYGTGVNFQYAIGAQLSLTDFVRVQTVTE